MRSTSPSSAIADLYKDEGPAARRIGPYRIIRNLGAGGMGVVWLAYSEGSPVPVALKLLPYAEISAVRRDWFAREVESLSSFNHRYVPRLYDRGMLADATPWFAMEYIDGEPLAEYCAQRQLSINERLRLFHKICEAIHHVHDRKFIHRDLNASNILVEKNGSPHVVDFGIARKMNGLADPGLAADLASLEAIRRDLFKISAISATAAFSAQLAPIASDQLPGSGEGLSFHGQCRQPELQQYPRFKW